MSECVEDSISWEDQDQNEEDIAGADKREAMAFVRLNIRRGKEKLE